jgi:hypothetical protein
MGTYPYIYAPSNPTPDDTKYVSYARIFAGVTPHITFKDPTVPDTHVKELQGYPFNKDPSNTKVEDFSQFRFIDLYELLYPVPDDVAPGMSQGWLEVKNGIITALHDFQTGLQLLESASDPSDTWKGATQAAAMKNIEASYPVLDQYHPDSVSTVAGVLSVLAQAFSTTMANTVNDIVSNYESYEAGLRDFPKHRDTIEDGYNKFAQKVMAKIYTPGITDIAQNYPSFYSGALPSPQPPSGPSDKTGTTGGWTAGGGPVPAGGASGAFSVPDVTAPNLPGMPSTPGDGQVLSAPQTSADPASALTAATQGLSSLSSPLQSALGQAASAAQQGANSGALGAANGLAKLPPEGALGLGPNGFKGSAGAVGRAGGGVAGPRLPMGKPAAGGNMADRTVAAGARAGLGATSGVAGGAPGAAGAPAGGNHGAAAGGQHQPAKALRRRKNGDEIIGDAHAVVAVLGEPTGAEAGKPNPT